MKPLSEEGLGEKIDEYVDRFRMQWKVEGDEYHQSELIEDIVQLILQDRKAWGEQVQKNMADNLINQERTLYKIFDDDISICVGIKRMADEVREYYDGGIYQKN